MRHLMTPVVLSACLLAATPAGAGAGDPRADDLLAQMRRAIGGQALERLQSLTFTGEFERAVGEAQMNGQFTLELAPPDKVRRDEQIDTPMGAGPTIVAAVNGGEAWRDVENSSMGGAHVVIRRPAAAPGADDGMPIRAEFQRLLLGLVANTSLLGLEASFAGQAESPDGVADVIDVRGEGGFIAQLFVDRETHLPLMVAYSGVPPQARMRVMRGGPGSHQGPAPDASADAEAAALAAAKPQPVAMQMFFGDHRKSDGLMLPTRITIQVAGKPAEEWRITATKVNAAVKADRFIKPSTASPAR